jgi:hypothetical protein
VAFCRGGFVSDANLASFSSQKTEDGLPLGFVHFLRQQLSVVLDIEMGHRSVHEGLPGQLSGMQHTTSSAGQDKPGEIELALERLSPNWARAAPRPRTGGVSYILQSLAHGRSHAVVLEIKRSPRRLGDSP